MPTPSEKSRIIRRLSDIPGIGASLAEKLAQRKITTKRHLRAIISTLPLKTQAHLRHKIERNITAKTGMAIAAELKRRIRFKDADNKAIRHPVVIVGSLRRKAPCSKDLDFLVIVPDNQATGGLLAAAYLSKTKRPKLTVVESYASGDRRRSFVVVSGSTFYDVDLFLATQTEKPYALFHFTGGREYNIRVRAHAKKQGYLLNQYGLFYSSTGRRVRGSTSVGSELDLAKLLGVTHRSPDQRNK